MYFIPAQSTIPGFRLRARLRELAPQPEAEIRNLVQSGASYLSQGFVMFFHMSCLGSRYLQYQPISRRNFPKHYLQNLATDRMPRSVLTKISKLRR